MLLPLLLLLLLLLHAMIDSPFLLGRCTDVVCCLIPDLMIVVAMASIP